MIDITWKKLREEQVKVGYRTLYRKYFKMPDGRELEWTTMERAQGACVMPITPDGKIVSATQFRSGPEKICLELPGGGLDPGEDPAAGAARELLEETGYAGELYPLAVTPRCSHMELTTHHFLALDCRPVSEPQNEADEFINVQLLDLQEFIAHVYAGDVTDGETALFGLRELEKRGLIPRAAPADQLAAGSQTS